MENKEFTFKGMTLNGFMMLFVNMALTVVCIALIALAIAHNTYGIADIAMIVVGGVMLVTTLFIWAGFMMVEPGEARVMMFFGNYRGTFTKVGYSWVNPFINTKKLSLRARNLDSEPIKVNDKMGNPIMIGLVLVWKLKDTYKAMFEIDSQTDADEINKQLESKLDERLSMAGIEVVEARINYLAYAPEIAAVMLRRQQAAAIISAREKIVEGAVSMVKMALDKLSNEEIVELDDDKKAAMVSNLLVVLCGDDSAQPVVNAGTLNH